MNINNRLLHNKFPLRTNAIKQFSRRCLGEGELFLQLRRDDYPKLCEELSALGDEFWAEFVEANSEGSEQVAKFLAKRFPQFVTVVRPRAERVSWWEKLIPFLGRRTRKV